jgi:rRNA biogenesis protein RRP5
VWLAYLNLEHTHGTQESLMKVFERALAHNEPKPVYFHLVGIYESANKPDARQSALCSLLFSSTRAVQF